jgi:hypothetical protein
MIKHIPYAEVLPWLFGGGKGKAAAEGEAAGEGVAAEPEPEVNVLPEPRAPFKGENPNYMGSVPRNELNKMAVGRKPGAGRQLQQLGQPIVYIPAEADVPPPRR